MEEYSEEEQQMDDFLNTCEDVEFFKELCRCIVEVEIPNTLACKTSKMYAMMAQKMNTTVDAIVNEKLDDLNEQLKILQTRIAFLTKA